MPAQLDPPSSCPQPLLLAGPSTMGRRSGGSVLVCLPPCPHFFISLFCLLVWHWGWGVAATCWLSDFWADCPLTGPSSEQKSRRGSPSEYPPPPTSVSLEGSGLPGVGRQGPKLSSRTALHFSWRQEGEWNSSP